MLRLFIKYIFVYIFIIYNIGFVISTRASARYDPMSVSNNKVGIHILETSEVEQAAKLVNSNGGDWGYVTIPIQPKDRNKDKWQQFLNECSRLHLIPIIRITTIPLGGTWVQGEATDLVDFANFLSSLTWPVGNRYIVLFNEVNRDKEWGGVVDPVAYAKILRTASTIFHERSDDFFLLAPALDDALPNSATSMSSIKYLQAMQAYDPNIWTYLDGWAAHSYPNPGFTSSPFRTGWQSIVGYRTAINFIKAANLPIFITETGWHNQSLSVSTQYSYWRQGWKIWNDDKKVVAVTPFILQGGSQFAHLSFINENGSKNPAYQVTYDLIKVAGNPPQGSVNNSPVSGSNDHETLSDKRVYKPATIFLQIENFFRQLFGLPRRGLIEVNGTSISVDLAITPKQLEQGLSGRANLDEGKGMLFLFNYTHTPAFWMKGMNFDLDLIWIKDGIVVDISKSVKKPENQQNLPVYRPSIPVNQVLEVPAGYSERHNIQIGDTVTIIR